MKILVGCKVVPEEQDIAVNGETLELSKANPKISQFDLNALQAAVDIKEQNADANIKVLSIGAEQTGDGIVSNWVQVEVQTGAKDRDGKAIVEGTVGWCFGGYLK